MAIINSTNLYNFILQKYKATFSNIIDITNRSLSETKLRLYLWEALNISKI